MQIFRRRALIAIAGAIVAATAAAGVAVPAMHTALQADIAWMRVDAPLQFRTRADVYYPWSAPVLSRWTEDGDAARAQYARETFARLGGFAAHAWFLRAVDTDAAIDISAADFTPAALRAFGFSTQDARRDLAERAAAHIRISSDYPPRFNSAVLGALGPDALTAIEAHIDDANGATRESLVYSLAYDRAGWTAAQRKRADALFRRIRSESAQIPSEKRTAADIAAERLNRGDRSVLPFFAARVNGDLHVFSHLGYAPNLLAVARAFPNSRLTRGYLAYDEIRGGTYFSREDMADENAGPALREPARWQAYLRDYGDHPGADDAAYWLGRAFAQRGERVPAAAAYANALENNLGDGDMHDVIAWRFMQLIDTGMRTAELDAYLHAYPTGRLTPIVRYARALRAARENTFGEALRLAPQPEVGIVDAAQKMQLFYSGDGILAQWRAQRDQWERLAKNPRDSGSAWNQSDGYLIGYNVFFAGMRFGGPSGDAPTPADAEIIRANTRAANANAQRIAFADRTLGDPQAGADAKRAAAKMRIVALYRQLAEYPDSETAAMGALPEFTAAARAAGDSATVKTGGSATGTSGISPEASEAKAEAAWTTELATSVEQFARTYPGDGFLPTAYLCAYEVRGNTRDLENAIAADPHGPRAEEARALLWRSRTPQQ